MTQGLAGTGQGRWSVCSSVDAWRAGAASSSERPGLEIAAERLLALDRLEQRLEVALAESARPVAFNHFEEERGPVLRRLREDLEQVTVLVAVGEDAQPPEVVPILPDLADAVLDV